MSTKVYDPFAEENAKRKAEEKRSGADGARLHESILEDYELYCTPGGEPFAVPRTGARRPLMLGPNGAGLRHAVRRDFYRKHGKTVSKTALEEALGLTVAEAVAKSAEGVELHLRSAQLGKSIVVDLTQPGTGRCVVITRRGWDVRENPPLGVFFRVTAATRPLPVPVRGGSLDELCEVLGFDLHDERWLRVKGWLIGSLFVKVARPLLFMFGSPGSAKTTRARHAVSVIDPREQLGSNFGKNPGDDRAHAYSRFAVSFDNIGSVSDTTSDALCRLVTGEEITERLLYSNFDAATITFKRTGVVTGVQLPNLKADAVERLITVELERIDPSGRRSELELNRLFEARHASILGALFDAVAVVLRNLSAVEGDEKRHRPRMADFFNVLAAYDETLASAYLDAFADGMKESAQADTFVLDTLAFMEARPQFNGDRDDARNRIEFYPGAPLVDGEWVITGTAEELAKAAKQRATGDYFPKNGSRWGSALSASVEPLAAVGITVERRKSGSRRTLTLRYCPPRDRGTGSAVPGDGSAVPSVPVCPTSNATVAAGQPPSALDQGTEGQQGQHLRAPSTSDLLGREERGERGSKVPATSVPAVPCVPAPAVADGGAHAGWPNPHGLPLLDEQGRRVSPLAWLFANVTLSNNLPLQHLIEDMAIADDETLDESSSAEEIVALLEDEGVPQHVSAAVRRIFGIEEEGDE